MSKALSEMSYAELVEHRQQTESMIKSQRAQALKDLVSEVNALIDGSDFDREEVLSLVMGKAVKSAGGKPRKPAIYFNPNDASQGWSGFGRAPNWVKEFLGIDKVVMSDPAISGQMESLKK